MNHKTKTKIGNIFEFVASAFIIVGVFAYFGLGMVIVWLVVLSPFLFLFASIGFQLNGYKQGGVK